MNNDLYLRITEEELEAIVMYWLSVGTNSYDARTSDELQRDRALALARLDYFERETGTEYTQGLSEEWQVTPVQEIQALEARGESDLQILEAKTYLGM